MHLTANDSATITIAQHRESILEALAGLSPLARQLLEIEFRVGLLEAKRDLTDIEQSPEAKQIVARAITNMECALALVHQAQDEAKDVGLAG